MSGGCFMSINDGGDSNDGGGDSNGNSGSNSSTSHMPL